MATLAQAGYALLLLLRPWRYDETGEFVFGPEAGEIEEVTLVSVVSKGVEVALVAVLLLAVRTRR